MLRESLLEEREIYFWARVLRESLLEEADISLG